MRKMYLQLFGGRGSNSESVTGSAGVTDAQLKTIGQIAKKTRNYKNEQYRAVNESGEVVLEKRGDGHSVTATVGEKRDTLRGAVTIHNHPDGGTFSTADLNDFGYGARAMYVAAPEGNYILENVRYGANDQYNGWYDMREAMENDNSLHFNSVLDVRKKAQEAPHIRALSEQMHKLSDRWVTLHDSGGSQVEMGKIADQYNKIEAVYKEQLKAEERRVEVEPYHNFLRANARKYGFRYTFIKA